MKPWISYSAAAAIEKLLAGRPCTVLEFGSGLSTIWFTQHAHRVCSVESDPHWYEIVKSKLQQSCTAPSEVEYHLASTKDEYAGFKSGPEELFDVILLDGRWRAECLRRHLHSVTPGGIIYLDNSDADTSSGEPGEITEATETLNHLARQHRASVERFTDFVPTDLFASQGLLMRMPL